MFEIFLKTLPFFALIALGSLALHLRLLSDLAAAALTRFVFYFALSAMLFKLAVSLPLAQIFDPALISCYLVATGGLYGLQFLLSRLRGAPLAEAAIEAQCACIGNTGFLGVPMLAQLLGPASGATVLTALVIDMVVFSTLVTLLVSAAKGKGSGGGEIRALGASLVKNPMIASMLAGFAFAALDLPLPQALDQTLTLLGAAATPCALFAIGASLASRRPNRVAVAGWLALAKMLLHPALMAICAFWLFDLPQQVAGLLIAVAALPVAGNIYILAEHFGVAPQRVSTAILFSTAASVLTIPLVIGWIGPL